MFCTAWCKEQSFTKASVYIPLSLPLTFLYFILPSSSSFPLPFFIPRLLIYSLILHPLPFPLLSFFLFLPSSPPSLPLLHFSHPFSFLLFFFVPDSLHYALCLPSPAPSFPTFLSACLLSLPSPPRPLPPSFSPLHCLHASPSSFLLSNLHHGPLLLFFLLPLPLPLRLFASPPPSFALLPSFLTASSFPSSFQTFTVALSFWPFSLPLPPHLSSSLFCFPFLLCSPFLPFPACPPPLPPFKPSPWPSPSDLSPSLSLLISPLPSFTACHPHLPSFPDSFFPLPYWYLLHNERRVWSHHDVLLWHDVFLLSGLHYMFLLQHLQSICPCLLLLAFLVLILDLNQQ